MFLVQFDFSLTKKTMAANISLGSGRTSPYTALYQVILVQVLVSVFLCINLLLISTFSRQEFFYTTMRYILFAVTLLSDSLFLLITDIMYILIYFRFTVQMWLCLIMCIFLSLYTFATPVTLTAMTLERYVAICRPLHHAELCSTRKAVHCILIIHCISSVPFIVIFSIFIDSAAHSFYTENSKCIIDIFIVHKWQSHLWSAISQFYFLIMCIVIVCCYFKIMKVAKGASGENKHLSWKGLRTVALHAFQLLLGLIQLWCPFIEAFVIQINFAMYVNVKYFDYIVFVLAPRCLSPLIYGLRDDRYFRALKHYVLCGMYQTLSENLF
ncbi:odorant receptor 131-2-like [Betta splendens]|uniref:Odorant receptor 131-2-like n=1 Tax=Betta splendens TaxID=158456 RepID=A0A6P7PEE1_BETSP|nr:odorant receptor 131-2-like [Betta splendens]